MSESSPLEDAWQAWQEPPRFLEAGTDQVVCMTLREDGAIAETLHPLVYGTAGMFLGGGLVAVVAMHEMKLLLARAKTLAFDVPMALDVAPVESGTREVSAETTRGKRMEKTG
ncbi:MAG TPA: hypothetical protein VFX59_03305 [Polyangiales bacterium]|nr:hypothetical protein [Polyangiales bacterium]